MTWSLITETCNIDRATHASSVRREYDQDRHAHPKYQSISRPLCHGEARIHRGRLGECNSCPESGMLTCPRLSADPSPKPFLIGIHSRKIAMAGTMKAVATAVTMAPTTTTIPVVVTVHAVVHGVVEGALLGPVAVAGEVVRRDRLGPPARKVVTAVSVELVIRFFFGVPHAVQGPPPSRGKASKASKVVGEAHVVKCRCDQPAAKQVVVTMSASKGREYWSCKSQGCSFFAWVDGLPSSTPSDRSDQSSSKSIPAKRTISETKVLQTP